jgi:Cap4 dsDNA endonuclease
MTASLFSDLTSKPQREIAGSDSAARFDYQKDWAFCRMMRKHISGEDYLVAFEYHDDVLFLTPADAPASAEFFQVKTSSSSTPRKLSSLTTRPRGKDSILAKMFANFEGICSSHDVKVILVSNNAFEFADKQTCAKDLGEKFRSKLCEKLKDEIPGFSEHRLEKLHFIVTGVSLEAMQSFLEGEAMELFCDKFGEDHGLNIRTWVRLVKGEIARRNNYPSDRVKNANDLILRKCVDHSFVEDTLNLMHAKTRRPPDMAYISTSLTSAGWKMSDIMSLEKKMTVAHRDYYDPTNEDAKGIAQYMRSKVISSDDGEPHELSDFLISVAATVESDPNVFVAYKHRGYLWAFGVIVYYDAV